MSKTLTDAAMDLSRHYQKSMVFAPLYECSKEDFHPEVWETTIYCHLCDSSVCPAKENGKFFVMESRNLMVRNRSKYSFLDETRRDIAMNVISNNDPGRNPAFIIACCNNCLNGIPLPLSER